MHSFLIILSIFLIISNQSLYAVIKLDNDTIHTKINKNKSKKINFLSLSVTPLKSIESKHNSIVISRDRGTAPIIKINGISAFRNNYSLNGIDITGESNSFFNINLLNPLLVNSVDVKEVNKNSSSPQGSIININTKLSKKNITRTTINSFNNVYMDYLGVLDNNSNIYASIFNEKNQYKFYYNNSTLYNYNDDFYKKKTDEKAKGASVAYQYDKNLNNIILNTSYQYNIMPSNLSTASQTNIYSMLSGKKKIIVYPFILNLSAYSHLNISNTYDTTSNFFDFTKRDINSKNIRLSMPISLDLPREKASISLSNNFIFENNKTKNKILKKQLVNFSRIKNSATLNSDYSSIIKINTSINFSYYKDMLTNSFIRNYNQKSQSLTTNNDAFTYTLQLSKKFKDFYISSNFGNGQRIPSLIEKFGDNIFIIPNPKLKEECSIFKSDTKIGYSSNFDFNISYSTNYMDNQITPNMYQNRYIKFINIDKTHIQNFSIQFSQKVNFIDFNILASKNIGKIKNAGNLFNNNIPYIFPYILRTNIRLNIDKKKSILLKYSYLSRAYTNNANFIYQHPEDENNLINGKFGFLPDQQKIDIGFLITKNYFSTKFTINNILNNRVTISPKNIDRGRFYEIIILMEY